MLKIDWDITSHLEPLPLDSSFRDQAAVCGRVQDDAKATEYIYIYIYVYILLSPGWDNKGYGQLIFSVSFRCRWEVIAKATEYIYIYISLSPGRDSKGYGKHVFLIYVFNLFNHLFMYWSVV